MSMNQTMLLSYLYKYQARTNLKEEVWTLGLKGCHLSLSWNSVATEACSGHSGPGSRVRVERRKDHASAVKASHGDPLPPGTLDLLSLLQSEQDHWSLVDPEPSENPLAGRQSHRSCSSLDLIKGVP